MQKIHIFYNYSLVLKNGRCVKFILFEQILIIILINANTLCTSFKAKYCLSSLDFYILEIYGIFIKKKAVHKSGK